MVLVGHVLFGLGIVFLSWSLPSKSVVQESVSNLHTLTIFYFAFWVLIALSWVSKDLLLMECFS